jgi:hypothetical protein
MTSSPDRPLRAAEIHANTMRAFKQKLVPIAYSDDGYRRKQGGSNASHPSGTMQASTTCKPRQHARLDNMQAARQLFET